MYMSKCRSFVSVNCSFIFWKIKSKHLYPKAIYGLLSATCQQIYIQLPSKPHARLYFLAMSFHSYPIILSSGTLFLYSSDEPYFSGFCNCNVFVRCICVCVCESVHAHACVSVPISVHVCAHLNVKVLNQFSHRFSHVVCSGSCISLLFYATKPLSGKCNLHHFICSTCEILGERL